MSFGLTVFRLKRPFIGTLWMWIIGSLLSQAAIFVVAPQDYRNGWYIYVVFTIAISAIGVFTFGFACLWFVHRYVRAFSIMMAWYFGIPIAILCGWLATALLIVMSLIVRGDAHQLMHAYEWLLFSLFGSIYGLVGALYMLATKQK